jgi:hypothetical protein
MNVERSIEHLLELHARAEQRMDKAEARTDRTDRQIEAIRKLVKTGMKLIVRIEAQAHKARRDQEEAHKDFIFRLNVLTDAQARTDAKIDKLAEIWLKRPPNGKPKR